MDDLGWLHLNTPSFMNKGGDTYFQAMRQPATMPDFFLTRHLSCSRRLFHDQLDQEFGDSTTSHVNPQWSSRNELKILLHHTQTHHQWGSSNTLGHVVSTCFNCGHNRWFLPIEVLGRHNAYSSSRNLLAWHVCDGPCEMCEICEGVWGDLKLI